MTQEEIIEKLEALKLERELPNEQTTDYNVGYVKALCIAMKLVEKLNIPPVIECVQFDADEIIAFLNDCKTLDEAKMFADEHLR